MKSKLSRFSFAFLVAPYISFRKMSGCGESSINYKFVNTPTNTYTTITFDGPYISLERLKKMIFCRLGTPNPESDLKVVDSLTKTGKLS